ncbi:MAG: hypothetical protein ACOVP4_13685 [Bacteriovoracaceae bacterium]
METQFIKAFFLGALTAEKPMPFNLAMDEVFVHAPEDKPQFEAPLKTEWENLSKNLKQEMTRLIDDEGKDDIEFLKNAQENLDYYLTGLTLSGTSMDSCENEDFADLIDEMEDVVLDLEAYIQEEDFKETETKEFKEIVLSLWSDVIETQSL